MTLRRLLCAGVLAGGTLIPALAPSPALADGGEIFTMGAGDSDDGRFGMLSYRHTFGDMPGQRGLVLGATLRHLRYDSGTRMVDHSGNRVMLGYKAPLVPGGVTTFTLGAEHIDAGDRSGAVFGVEHWQGLSRGGNLFAMLEHSTATDSTYAALEMKLPLRHMKIGPKLAYTHDGDYRSVELGLGLGVPLNERTELMIELGRRKADLADGTTRYTTVGALGIYFTF